MLWCKLFFVVMINLFFLTTCTFIDKSTLILHRIELKKNAKIDTISSYYNDSLLLVNINTFSALGNFTSHCGYIRKFGSERVIYEAVNFTPFRVSSNYLVQILPDYFDKLNFGWFAVGSNGIIRELPHEKEILDSIKLIYPSDYFVTTNHYGFFTVYKNANIVIQFNYGNIVLNDKDINFNKFEFGLYKISNNRLLRVSDSPDNLLKRGAGLYFVPQPGLGVKRKFLKSSISNSLMSYSTLSDCPQNVRIYSEN